MYVTLHDSADRLRFTVPCAAFVADDSDGLLLLELVGADSENRAVWSHIVKARPERSLTATRACFHAGGAEHVIQVIPSTKYHKVEQTGRVILLHDGLTRFRYEYLLAGTAEDPSPWFLPALQLRLPIPVLPHWTTTLWAAALADHVVQAVTCAYSPVAVWRLASDDPRRWGAIIQHLIQAKQLSVEALP